MHDKKQYLGLLPVFFLVLYILPLGARDLIVPDETRYGAIPREMIATGYWIVPHLNGLRYFEKPPMGYWVHAGSILLFGENNFAVRLPSAMAVGLSALLIFTLVYRVCRNTKDEGSWTVILAVLIFLTCFEVYGVGNTAVLDSLFSFFLTATISAFYFATEAFPGSAGEKRFLLLAGIACGVAFLTKGFLAFALPVLILVPYLVWQRRYRDLWRMGWLPILTAVLVALPWTILIHLQEPDFWRFFFWNEHVRRFIAEGAQHKESFWFFFMTAPGMFMPWTFVTPAAVAGVREQFNDRSPQARLIRLSICWLALPFLFFSVSNGKLLTYILPCFPPFSILMAFGLSRSLDNGTNKTLQWGVVITGTLFGVILLSFSYVQLFGFQGFRPYSQPWKALMAASGAVFAILFCLRALRCREGMKKILYFGLSPFLLFLTAHFLLPDLTIQCKTPGALLERHDQDVGRQTVVISDENTLRAVCWYLKRSNVYMLEGAGELDYGLAYEDAGDRLVRLKSVSGMVSRNRGRVVLIARAKNINHWRDRLPKPVYRDNSGPDGYVFWQY